MNRLIGLAVLGFLISGSVMAQPAPDDKSFQFSQFDSLPPQEINPTAKAYFAEHFPAGTDLEIALGAIRNAGADCSYKDTPPMSWGCKYKVPSKSIMAHLTGGATWFIVINIDQANPQKISSIFVNREVNGL